MRRAASAGCVVVATLCSLAFAGPAPAGISVPPGGQFSIPAGGSASLSCTDVSDSGTLSVNAGQLVGIANVAINSGGVLNGGSGLIQFSGNWTNAGTFNPGTGTVQVTQSCTTGPFALGNNTTFDNLTLGPGTYLVSGCPGLQVNGVLTLAAGVTLQSQSGQACIQLPPGSSVVGPAPMLDSVTLGLPTTQVPALSEVGVLLLALLMGAMGAMRMVRTDPAGNTQDRNVLPKIRKGSRHA